MAKTAEKKADVQVTKKQRRCGIAISPATLRELKKYVRETSESLDRRVTYSEAIYILLR
jgi:hypothetical protein